MARPPPLGTSSPSSTILGLAATPYFGSIPPPRDPTFWDPQLATRSPVATASTIRGAFPENRVCDGTETTVESDGVTDAVQSALRFACIVLPPTPLHSARRERLRPGARVSRR